MTPLLPSLFVVQQLGLWRSVGVGLLRGKSASGPGRRSQANQEQADRDLLLTL